MPELQNCKKLKNNEFYELSNFAENFLISLYNNNNLNNLNENNEIFDKIFSVFENSIIHPWKKNSNLHVHIIFIFYFFLFNIIIFFVDKTKNWK